MATFYDTHAHLDYPDFAADMPQVIERAAAAGIAKMISVGTDLESSRRAVRLAEQYPQIFAAVGVHPNHAHQAPDDVRPALRELAKHPKVVAMGEMGLDFYRLPSKESGGSVADDEISKRQQARIFEQQLEVAAETGLNCIIHQRDSLEETLAQMRPWAGKVGAVFHCFTNDADVMRRLIGLGYLVSFTGIMTFKNAQNIRDTLAATPLDKFMLETDCPYLTPEPHRKVRRCEPMFIEAIAQRATRVKGCGLEQLSQATTATARSFFPKMS